MAVKIILYEHHATSQIYYALPDSSVVWGSKRLISVPVSAKPQFLYCLKLQQSRRSIRGGLLKLLYMNIMQPLRLITSLQG